MNPLTALVAHGQSPWLDFVRRDMLTDGRLSELVERDGLRGVTSNPAIFQKALSEGAEYEPALAALVEGDAPGAAGLYEALAVEDIRMAADILRPVFEASGGADGFVSLEVSPYLADDSVGTIEEAHRLWRAVDRPNLMVKVPGTEAGIEALTRLIGDGINVNVTLLFARTVYARVVEAYMAGLEDLLARGGDPRRVGSVASFFVSRIDAVVDRLLTEHSASAAGPEKARLEALRGRAAIANAKAAYRIFRRTMQSERWAGLAEAGARPQRLLWASTGTKDPSYPDVLYVEELIGPDTVNTMPPQTLDAFRDHGRVEPTLMRDIDEADAVLADLGELGIDLDRIAADLVEHGVRQFADAADTLLAAVEAKRQAALGGRLAVGAFRLGDALDGRVAARLQEWRRAGTVRRLWWRDHSLWPNGGAATLAWLDALGVAAGRLSEFAAFGAEIATEGFADAVLVGMGGTTLAGSALAATFGARPGFPRPHLLDTTDPDGIRALEAEIDLERTLFVVASKSGTTLETDLLLRHVLDRLHAAGGRSGRHLVAITDAGSPLDDLARREGFRRVFHAEPGTGGRFSALSSFACVPAALTGHDLEPFVRATRLMVQACGAEVPPDVNPGVRLGVTLAEACAGGRDKLTLVLDPELAPLGPWLEQLVAGATGKAGRAILPVLGEPLGGPAAYGDDRLFVRIALGDRPRGPDDVALDRLADDGQPVIRIDLAERAQIGQELFRWEMAAAVAAALLGVDPFDRPDLVTTGAAVAEPSDAGAATSPSAEATIGVSAGADGAVAPDDLPRLLRTHLRAVPAGGYVALLAYLPPRSELEATLASIRLRIRDRLGVATLVGFGPRYLHGTGPAFKGGPDTGVFLVLTARPERDVPVPGRSWTFGALERAQALGDVAVMRALGRPTLGLHFGAGADAGLRALSDLVDAALA